MPTKIEWAEESWNFVTGCSPVSEACQNCYARRMANRLRGRYGYPHDDQFKVTFHPDKIGLPSKWRKSRRIFPVSMGDIFHKDVSDGLIMWAFWVMAHNPQHTYMLLTKRPERMLDWFTKWSDTRGDNHEFTNARGPDEVREAYNSPRSRLFADMLELWGDPPDGCAYPTYDWMEGPKIWSDEFFGVCLGVTAENQKAADERILLLLQCPAAVRFVSAEPLLGPIDFHFPTRIWGTTSSGKPGCDHCCNGDRCDDPSHIDRIKCPYCRGTGYARKPDLVIVGGETGPGARPMHPEWARDIRDQCQAADVPFFFKSWGEWATNAAFSEQHPCPPVKAKPMWMREDGMVSEQPLSLSDAEQAEGEIVKHNWIRCAKVGKKVAGRILDGRTWEEFPK